MPPYQKNPFVENYISQLALEKGKKEGLDEAQVNRLVEGLYTRFESMLGRNLVEYLPENDREEVRKKLQEVGLEKGDRSVEIVTTILSNVNMEEINFPDLLKVTLQELSDEVLNS